MNQPQDALDANLSTLIMSIASSAAMSMGLSPNEEGNVVKNQVMAKFHVDLLKIIEQKTQNNLTPEEKKLLSQILTDLQLKFVEMSLKEKS